MNARVSVVIPTYNRCVDVMRAINSALAQTLPPHEVIVVDDGSTDGTAAAIQALPAPVKYLYKPNGGVSSARNLAFKQVTGDFVCLCDSDDYWDSTWLETATNVITSTTGAGAAVCTRLSLVAPDGRPMGMQDFRALEANGAIALPSLFLGGIMGSNLCIRTDVLRAVGEYDPSLQTAEDIDFALRIATLTVIVPVVRPLIYVTQSVGSLSKYLNTGNRLKVFSKFEERSPELAARYSNELHSARVETTLSYTRDLIIARQFPAAWSRLRESWAYRPTWEAVLLSAKITLLTLFGLDKSRH